MKGKSQSFGNTDGNNIPSREAFDWYRSAEGPGMAVWYKNSGPWWDQTNLKANDGISLEEELHDPGSLFNYYKRLIRLRQSNAALAFGKYEDTENNNPNVYSFYRVFKGEKVLVAVNLSNQLQHVQLLDKDQKFRIIYGLNPHKAGQHQLTLKPFEFIVLALKPTLKKLIH
jgi:glycosidase